ncbi:MAG: AGE family epimerase/isomerase [Myxococcota bacterium]
MNAQPSLRTCARLLPAALLALAACGDDAGGGDAAPDAADTASSDGADATTEVDADTTPDVAPDTTLGDDVYGPHAPPTTATPDARKGAVWPAHWQTDLEPFWTSSAALGTPVGNYPTYRTMTGAPAANTKRRPRMISRQIYAYVVGYQLTGDPALLDDAQAGVTWLRDHAIDRTHGGCFTELAADGSALDSDRTAQDQAYCMLGLAAWVYLTRDPAAEADLLAGHALLFDPTKFWDASHGRIKDGLDKTLTNEIDVDNNGGSELVAQLDPINGFMLLSQPVLAAQADQDQFLTDLRTLGQAMIRDFDQDGIIWGVSSKKGQYGSSHADFGHALKALWMLLQIDKRHDDHPFHDYVAAHADTLLGRAFDTTNGRWAKRYSSATGVEYGNDWWIAAEEDQFAATLDLTDGRYDAILGQTQAHWLATTPTRSTPARSSSVKRDGSPVYPWPAGDTAKCNEWKNGYHSSEHALVMAMLGDRREGKEVTLHFAVPVADVETFVATPYIFLGRELGREAGATHEVGGRVLQDVTVRFADLY